MSIERARVYRDEDRESRKKIGPEEKEAAMELIRQDPYLKNDIHARNVVENGGITIDGIDVGDLRDFLASRAATLTLDAMEKRNPNAVKAAMVVSSVAPEHERNL